MTVIAPPAVRGRVQHPAVGGSCGVQRANRRITCQSFKPRKRPGSVSPPASPVRRTHRPLNTSVNVQKLWRINYYGARRAGGEQENLRRAQRRESPPPAQQSSSYEPRSLGWGADTGAQDSWQSDRRPTAPDPRNVRRRSVDYASRRSGGDPENQRRKASSETQRHVPTKPPSQNGSSYSSYTSDSTYSSSLPPTDGPKMDPRVQRRQSVDYAARRSGSGRARSAPVKRSSSGPVSTRQVPSEPVPTRRGSYSNSSHGSTPNVAPRESVDYSARRTGGDPENARRRISASPNSSASHSPAPSVIRRKSVDYASRRSGGQEENMRRRSQDFSIPPGSGAPPQVPVTASEALERVRQLAARRQSNPDYAARRSTASDEFNNGRRGLSLSSPRATPPVAPPASPSVAPPASPPVAPPVTSPASSNGHHSSYDHSNGTAQRAEQRANKPYIARKSVPSYASRRSQDFPGRPGDPRRRRSMARFTLAEVKSALANRKRSQSGPQRSASADNSRNGNGARPSALDESVDYGAHAMQSVEQLMGAYSDLAGVPVHQLKVDLSSDYRFPYNHDPAEGALNSLDKVADLIAKASPAAGGSRW